MTIMKKAVILSVLGLLIYVPSTMAMSGVNMDDVRVKLYTEQGDDWFRAKTLNADSHGIIEAEGVIPGWYKMKVGSEDEKSTQFIAVRLRMRDADGKELKEDTPVDLYVKINDIKTFIGTVDTDKYGWLELENLSLDTEYKMEIDERDGGVVNQKDGRARIKVNAKIDDSDWFRALYERTDENYTLKAEGVLPGKYKYKYKSGDRDISLPFNLYVRLVNEKGEKLKDPTKVNLYAYVGPEKTKTMVGQVMTDAKGWLFVPGVMTQMKYAFEVIED